MGEGSIGNAVRWRDPVYRRYRGHFEVLATASFAVKPGTTSISSSCILNTKSIPTPFADRPPPRDSGRADLISIRFSYILPSAPIKALTLAAVLPAALNPTRLMLNILNENFRLCAFQSFRIGDDP